MSRPRGSGFAVSKSIKASAASIGSDFLYPTAFIWRFSLYPADNRRSRVITCGFATKLQGLRAGEARCRLSPIGPKGDIGPADHFYWRDEKPIFGRSILRESFHDRYSCSHGIAGFTGRDRTRAVPGPARSDLAGGTEALLRADRAARAAGGGQCLCRQDRAKP